MTEQERIQSIKTHGGFQLKRFQSDNITYGMCIAAVESDGGALQFVPDKFRTEEIYLAAVENDGEAKKLYISARETS